MKGRWITALGLGWLLAAPMAWGGTSVGGYFRVAARPDLQGGNGRLGYWNLYGRLMNEGSYGMVDVRVGLVEPSPGTNEIWSSVHMRVEGGSIGSADPDNGVLSAFRLSEFYVRAGNVLIPGVEWRVGTLYFYQGDLGLYDFRPSNLFFESVGASARIDRDKLELIVGVGDAGFFMRRAAYNTIVTPGGAVRWRLGKLELGGGGQLYIEPKVAGKRTAPHTTPGIDYEEWVRGEVVERFLEQNPGQESQFTDPEPLGALSYKTFGYVGFGGFGPVIWNNLWVSYGRGHPDVSSTETFAGRTYDLYTTALTDERYAFDVGNELQLRVVPGRFDVAWAFYLGHRWDLDNEAIVPSDHDRTFASSVVRGQLYLTETTHWLLETSYAVERSTNGNTYRNHADSLFKSEDGRADADGLEFGDADTRLTWQGKTGLVLNPLGTGIYNRPSLRVLYGVQHSTQNNAFGNAFVETQDQFDDFDPVERHLHHLVSLETEVWF